VLRWQSHLITADLLRQPVWCMAYCDRHYASGYASKLMPQLQQDKAKGFTFQQEVHPSHFHCEVTSYLSHAIHVWIGRGRPVIWPSHSPDFMTEILPVEIHERLCLCPPHPTTFMCTDQSQKLLHQLMQIWDETAAE
jgi:hypothetical protein